MAEFGGADSVAGCCGYDGYYGYRGALTEASVHAILSDETTEVEEWDSYLDRYVKREVSHMPIVLATSVEQDDDEKDSLNYITPAVAWAIKNGWKYIRTPAHLNPNTDRMVALLVLYTPDIHMDNTLAGSNL